jgi:hypothetical protein
MAPDARPMKPTEINQPIWEGASFHMAISEGRALAMAMRLNASKKVAMPKIKRI